MPLPYLALAAAAAAQAAAPQPIVQPTLAPASVAPAPVQAMIVAAPTQSVLRAGTEVPLRMEQGLDSNDKGLREGQQIRMSVASDVRVGNLVVIPAGSPATGEITDLRRKGMWGKSGRINARALNVRVGDRLIRLTGTFDDKGVTGTAGVVAAIAFVPIAGFFMTGTSAKIPSGGGVKAFLDEDLTIAVPQPAPAVAVAPVVQAAAPVLAPVATTSAAPNGGQQH
jgi:hypothetical protein